MYASTADDPAITVSGKTYDGFELDDMLHAPSGADIHFSARTPLRLFTGRDDSYYGSDSFVQTASELRSLYTGDGLSEGEIDKLVVLDVKEADYFTQRGFSDQHAGGGAAATDAEVMEWLFSKR